MNEIKKYAIHILAVTAFNPKYYDLPFNLPQERNAIIVCSGREKEYINNYTGNKLLTGFLDVQEGKPCNYGRWQIIE